MSKDPTVTEVARNFAEYVNRVAFKGERFTLVRGGKPVAELTPVPAGKRLGDLPALLASLPRLSEAEAFAFEDDLERGRAGLLHDGHGERDPWDS